MPTINVGGGNLTTDQKFDIDAFRNSVHENGFHRISHFNMVITPPVGLRGVFTEVPYDAITPQEFDFGDVASNLVFNIETTELPGVAIATDEHRRYGIGNFERKPYVPTFSELTVTVRSDSSGMIYKFFQSWMKLIVNFDVAGGSRNSATGLNGSVQYEVAYKSEYATTAMVITYNENGDENINTRLINLYPIYLSPTSLIWTDNGIVKFQVKFTYSEWFLETATRKKPAPLPPR